MRIALDVMGGDFGPSVILDGVKLWVESKDSCPLLLVGSKEIIESELKIRNIPLSDNLSVLNADQVVSMEESPRDAYRHKKDSSIMVAVKSVSEGKADAFATMGNTGAAVFTAQLILGCLSGVKRPGLAIPFPTQKKKPCIMMDMGASVHPKADHLLGYSIMAYYYSKCIFHNENPVIGLMNVGEETKKGNDLVKEAYASMQNANINFQGNAEGGDCFTGKFDAIVCDGFTGNVLLKSVEQCIRMMTDLVREEIGGSIIAKLGAVLLKPSFGRIKKKTNPSEYGGALLLGVDGVCVIGHGKADGLAVFNALKNAKIAHEQNLNGQIVEELNKIALQASK